MSLTARKVALQALSKENSETTVCPLRRRRNAEKIVEMLRTLDEMDTG